MKDFAILFLLLFSLGLNGQDNYIEYHLRYYKVEELVAQEKFVEAEKLLRDLFVDYEPKFAKDYLVAAQLCALNQHLYLGVDFLEKAMLMGVKKECIEELEALAPLLETKKWERLIKRYDRLRFRYAQSINFGLLKEFSGRYQVAIKTYLTDGHEDAQELAKHNFSRLQAAIKDEGFPGQTMVGIDDAYYNNNDWNKYHDCDCANKKVVGILRAPYSFSILKEELELALKNGDLSPSEFLYIYFQQDQMLQGNHDHGFYKNIRKREIDFPNYHFYPTHSTETTPQKIKADRVRFGARPSGLRKQLEPIEKKYGMRLIYEGF